MAEAEAILARVKEAPPADGFDEVMIPGEPEARLRARRLADGIPLPDAVWAKIGAAARAVGVDAGEVVKGVVSAVPMIGS